MKHKRTIILTLPPGWVHTFTRSPSLLWIQRALRFIWSPLPLFLGHRNPEPWKIQHPILSSSPPSLRCKVIPPSIKTKPQPVVQWESNSPIPVHVPVQSHPVLLLGGGISAALHTALWNDTGDMLSVPGDLICIGVFWGQGDAIRDGMVCLHTCWGNQQACRSLFECWHVNKPNSLSCRFSEIRLGVSHRIQCSTFFPFRDLWMFLRPSNSWWFPSPLEIQGFAQTLMILVQQARRASPQPPQLQSHQCLKTTNQKWDEDLLNHQTLRSGFRGVCGSVHPPIRFRAAFCKNPHDDPSQYLYMIHWWAQLVKQLSDSPQGSQ